MSDSNIYNSSSFFETIEGEINAQFTGFTDEHSPWPWMCVKGVTRFGQRWRVKGVDPDYTDPDEARRLIDSEFEHGVTLWHPSIVRMIACQNVPTLEGKCIIEEWVEGTPLGTAYNAAEGLQLARQLIDAVSYYTGKGFVHGNLDSPGSIVVNERNGSLKVRDFDPRAIDIQTDFKALAAILSQLVPQTRFKKIITHCSEGRYTNGQTLKSDFERAASRKRWRGLTATAIALLAIAAVGLFFVMGRQRKAADNRQLPPGYGIDSVAPKGNFSIFSTVSQSDIYLMFFDSVTPVPKVRDLAVDLGLSVKWSKMNLGCVRPTINTVGKFYGWGDTTDSGTWGGLDKYWPAERAMPKGDISGSELDFARRRWGGQWRIPTRQQWEELVSKCTWKYRVANDGAAGYVVTGPNGNSIFLPLAGFCSDGINVENTGRFGYYWTATPAADGKRSACYILIDQRNIITDNTEVVNTMMSVRPVTD